MLNSLDSNDKIVKKGKVKAYKINKYIAIHPPFHDKTSDKWDVTHILTGLAFGVPYDDAETAKKVAEAFAKFGDKLNFSSFEAAPNALIKELIKTSRKFR